MTAYFKFKEKKNSSQSNNNTSVSQILLKGISRWLFHFLFQFLFTPQDSSCWRLVNKKRQYIFPGFIPSFLIITVMSQAFHPILFFSLYLLHSSFPWIWLFPFSASHNQSRLFSRAPYLLTSFGIKSMKFETLAVLSHYIN